MFVDEKMHEQLKLPEFRIMKKETSEVSQSVNQNKLLKFKAEYLKKKQ